MGRVFFVGGNWKCNGTKASLTELCSGWKAAMPEPVDSSKCEVVIAPTAIHIPLAMDQLPAGFQLATQNCWTGKGGAFTGELSAEMIKDMGVQWVVLGHSERRTILGESDDFIATKCSYALSQGLGVIACIGELLEERENGSTNAVCEKQLTAMAAKITDWSQVVIAYEPVWAIGTGKVASPEQAQEVHAFIRQFMAKEVSAEVAASVRIIYGGSVSPKNCDDLAKKEDVDGFLVGGASLKPDFPTVIASHVNKA